ncbi:MAG: hypothetical protein IJ737_01245 [Ruminococcus sp.]|nr:hypothetical protein [Ruminococcus sp.]MBR2282926.1 hypothetical protein [Ruminococcus sp.]
MNYIGEKCVYCYKVFTEEDDVVVCPECGSPHHRACYAEYGKCSKFEFHIIGFQWERENKPSDTRTEEAPRKPDAPVGIINCPSCGFPNVTSRTTCEYCGTVLKKPGTDPEDRYDAGEIPDIFSAAGAADPEEDMGGVTLGEVTHFVSTNTLYYIPVFRRMKALGTRLSLNLLCFLFPPVFFANRRMWGWAVLSAAVMILIGLPSMVEILLSESVSGGISLFSPELTSVLSQYSGFISRLSDAGTLLQFVQRIVFSSFANFIYMGFSIRSLKKLRKATGKPVIPPEIAEAAGGARPLNMLLICVIFFAASYAAMFGATVFMEFLVMMSGAV